MNIVAIIPARGGSVGVPKKNIRPLAGLPLISFSIRSARDSALVDRVLVSTDSEEIAEIARKEGGEVPFLRPADISGGNVSDAPVMIHAVNYLEQNEDYKVDIVVILRPTTPLRELGLIDRCINQLCATNSDSVRSVRNMSHFHPYWMLNVDEEGMATSYIENTGVDHYYQRQLLPDIFRHDGYCDVIKASNLPEDYSPDMNMQGFYGKRMSIVKNEVEHFINIDTEADFAYAEYVLGLLNQD